MLIANHSQPQWPQGSRADVQMFVLGNSWVPLCLQKLLPGLTSEKPEAFPEGSLFPSHPPSRMPGNRNTVAVAGQCLLFSGIQGSSSGKGRGWAPTTTRCLREGLPHLPNRQLPFSPSGARVTLASLRREHCGFHCPLWFPLSRKISYLISWESKIRQRVS